MRIIAAAYPAFEVTRERAELWAEMLADLPTEEALRNLRQHIRTGPYPPTIADVRGTYQRRSSDREPGSWREGVEPIPREALGERAGQVVRLLREIGKPAS